MKAVFLDFSTMGDGLDLTPLLDVTPNFVCHDVTEAHQVEERIADADIVYTNKIQLNDTLLAAAKRLRFIGLTATGTDNIDTVTAKKNSIAVANIRDYCTNSVAEHVFGSLLMLTHNLAAFDRDVQDGAWQKSVDAFLLTHPVREISGKTLGIVGYGSLGRGVARVAAGFGMDVLVSARPGSGKVGDGRTAFDDMLTQSDIISLHCPLNAKTSNLFSAAQFEKMKDTAILINTARGGLVDSSALVSALQQGIIAGAAVDVLPEEPPVNGDPLLDYEGNNLIVTPHVAWASDEARQNAIDELAANARAFIAGEERNRVV